MQIFGKFCGLGFWLYPCDYSQDRALQHAKFNVFARRLCSSMPRATA